MQDGQVICCHLDHGGAGRGVGAASAAETTGTSSVCRLGCSHELFLPSRVTIKRSVRICGNFKLTVNAVSKLDTYPIPQTEDPFAKLVGGVSFSKLNHSQVYQQLELEEESKQLVVINTHRGLFRFTRLPFGVSSLPGIFQGTMECLMLEQVLLASH